MRKYSIFIFLIIISRIGFAQSNIYFTSGDTTLRYNAEIVGTSISSSLSFSISQGEYVTLSSFEIDTSNSEFQLSIDSNIVQSAEQHSEEVSINFINTIQPLLHVS